MQVKKTRNQIVKEEKPQEMTRQRAERKLKTYKYTGQVSGNIRQRGTARENKTQANKIYGSKTKHNKHETRDYLDKTGNINTEKLRHAKFTSTKR